MVQVQRDDGYIISTDPARLDVNSIHAYIAGESYWARGRSRALMETAIANSLCFGMYAPATGAQVAFARIISDFAVFAYLCDLFVEPAHQGRGLGKWFVQTIVNAPELATVRRTLLVTRDAHTLYRTYAGFDTLPEPEMWMARVVDQ
jgi:GNAT superfamily N-acetyltransferase